MSSISSVCHNGVSVSVYENAGGVHVSGEVKQQLFTVSYAQGRSVNLTGENDFSPECWFQQLTAHSRAGGPDQSLRRLQKIAHGCVELMDVPRGFQEANDSKTKLGVTKFSLPGDEKTTFMSSISHEPLPGQEAERLTDLLKRQCGPLSRAELHRMGELVEMLGATTVGDNQFAPGAGEFGTPEAPRFFLNKADIVNLSGCRALLIEGRFVSASWSPGTQPPKSNYAGAFFATPDGGVQCISLQGSCDATDSHHEGRAHSSPFQNHYYKFLRTLKTLQWRGDRESIKSSGSVETNQKPCLILRIGEPLPDSPHEIRWVS